MSSFLHCIDSFKRRRWEHIRSNWLLHIPYLTSVGDIPQSAVAEVADFDAVALALISENQQNPASPLISADEELLGLREAVFSESLFLLHKARHVVGAAEFHVRDGLQTWALANAYQGAFFAAKAILGFLGASFPEYNSRTIAIDLFPGPVARADQYLFCSLHYIGNRMEHRPIWDIFQRLLGVSIVEVWPKHIVNKLKSIESKNFALQRNHIHYRNNGWLLNDLNDFLFSDDFGDSNSWNRGLDFDRDDISMAIALSVLKMGLLLVQDLEKSSAKLTPELQLFSNCVENGRHPIYGNLLRC